MADFLFRVVSMEEWPADVPRTKRPRSASFRAPYSATLKLLARELGEVDAKNVVLECDADWSHIRQDGQLRADARLKSQGVVLSFESRHGPLRYPCDAFDTWQDNLRAIALSLEALRKVDRYGVAKRGEQYRGWDKLPPAGGTSITLDAEGAARVVARAAYPWAEAHEERSATLEVLRSVGAYQSTLRDAQKRTHPDAGGTTERFQAVQQAREILDAHHHLRGVAR